MFIDRSELGYATDKLHCDLRWMYNNIFSFKMISYNSFENVFLYITLFNDYMSVPQK